ncbi:MAG: TIGR02147 family protein [Myxococcales bacterium]|nr:TIGR02147 family protein [Myxococcales bacterium]
MTDAPSPPDVHEYVDFRAFLRDWFDFKKRRNPRFSHRSFARLAGQRSPSVLLHVMRGERNLSPANVTAFVQAMKLTEEEAEFFGLLVSLAQADSPKERERAGRRVASTRRFREARKVQGGGFEYLSHWYYPAIRELAHRSDFVADPEWVARTLCPSIQVDEAARALQVLFELDLLQERPDGTVTVTETTVVTEPEIVGVAVHNYHYGMLKLATEAIRRFHSDERQFSASTLLVPDHVLPELKKEALRFHERVLNLCDSDPGPHSRVHQLSVCLFPLSEPEES